MRNLLNTLICILLTSPLAAFDITLEGVELGFLQMRLNDDAFAGGSEVVSKTITLNKGDIMQVLQVSPGSNNFNGIGVGRLTPGLFVVSNGIETKRNEAGYIVGPASVRVGYKFDTEKNKWKPYLDSSFYFYRADYAILRAKNSP